MNSLPTSVPPTSSEPRAELTIGDVSEQTGVAVPTLRMWESRHGFPVPQRLESGHRRYRAADVAAIRAVARSREEGMRLDVAISRAVAHLDAVTHPAAPSVYAGLRQSQPHLATHRLRKSTLLGLSWAIEDEFAAKAEHAHLFGAFQREERYAAARPRWTELARVADSSYVFADFPSPDVAARPCEVALAPSSPMLREWAVVCDAEGLPAALTAWELPGQVDVPDGDRLFESVWTVDPTGVREAARMCAGVAHAAGAPGSAELVEELAHPVVRESTDVVAVTSLFNRIVAYVDAAGKR